MVPSSRTVCSLASVSRRPTASLWSPVEFADGAKQKEALKLLAESELNLASHRDDDGTHVQLRRDGVTPASVRCGHPDRTIRVRRICSRSLGRATIDM